MPQTLHEKEGDARGEVDEVDEKAAADFFELLEKLADVDRDGRDASFVGQDAAPPPAPSVLALPAAGQEYARLQDWARQAGGRKALCLPAGTGDEDQRDSSLFDSAGIDVTAKLGGGEEAQEGG